MLLLRYPIPAEIMQEVCWTLEKYVNENANEFCSQAGGTRVKSSRDFIGSNRDWGSLESTESP